MKTCSKCGEEKDFSEFYKNKRYSDGYYGQCKECLKEVNKKYRADNKEKIKERERKYKDINRSKVNANQRRYYKENKKRMRERRKKFKEKNPYYGAFYRIDRILKKRRR